jgi:putative transposase
MLAKAIDQEVQVYLAERSHLVDEARHPQVVRNGYKPARTVLTGLGPIEVRQPRVRDRRSAEQREKFTSKLLPPYLRKTPSVEGVIPWLYLYGISSDDFPAALASLLGPSVQGLSASTVTRLKGIWEQEFKEWNSRSLAGKRYAYIWADGIYFNIRLEDDRQCILVLMGATADGKKELIAIADGYRESEQSWTELLLSCKARGLEIDPKLAIADGALGFWAAARKLWPQTREQRCWVHKTANVLSKMPKHLQGKAKGMLHDIWMASTRAEANQAFDLFLETFRAKYPKAVECLEKDRDKLLAFYDFPAEHWPHLRTTNPIESTFATVRLRHDKTKGNGSRTACLTMVFKLAQVAEGHWRALNGSALVQDVIAGIPYVDGVKTQAA